MAEDDTPNSINRHPEGGDVVPLPLEPANPHPFEMVRFDRRELDQILRVYSFMVGAGEWRDYAIDHLKDRAVFSVFRRASEVPLYQIQKVPKLARRQGAFRVTAASGLILKRGHELANVLRVFDKPLRLVASS